MTWAGKHAGKPCTGSQVGHFLALTPPPGSAPGGTSRPLSPERRHRRTYDGAPELIDHMLVTSPGPPLTGGCGVRQIDQMPSEQER